MSKEYLTLEAVAIDAEMHPDNVRCYLEFGLIHTIERRGDELFFDPAVIPRLRMIVRLRRSLGVNLAGIAVILDMRERIIELQRRVEVRRNDESIVG